jgi:hypothetical protein
MFDLAKLLNNCKKKITFDWAIASGEVSYPKILRQDDLPFVINTDIIDKKTEEGYARHCFDIAKNLWFNKNNLWSYENEYRILLYSEEEGPIKMNIKDCLRAIIFGSNVSNVIKRNIGSYCMSEGFDVFFVEFDERENSYKLYPLEFL